MEPDIKKLNQLLFIGKLLQSRHLYHWDLPLRARRTRAF